MGRNWLQKKNIFFGDPDFFNNIAHVLGARGPPRLRLQRPLLAPRVPAISGSHTSATFATHTGGGSQIARTVTKFPSVLFIGTRVVYFFDAPCQLMNYFWCRLRWQDS